MVEPKSPGQSRFNLVELAQRLKRIRVERGLTLEEVASRAGLTRGWLSKVENFRVTPSLPALANIAGVLGTQLAELLSGLDARPAIVVVRKGERVRLRRDEEVSQLEYESLAHTRPSRNMDPFVIKVPPSDDRPLLTHAGEEFILLLKGACRLEYAGAAHLLEHGDSAYFDGDQPHRFVCVGPEAAEVLVIYHGVETGGEIVDDEAGLDHDV